MRAVCEFHGLPVFVSFVSWVLYWSFLPNGLETIGWTRRVRSRISKGFGRARPGGFWPVSARRGALTVDVLEESPNAER